MGRGSIAGKRTTESKLKKQLRKETHDLDKRIHREYMDTMRPICIAEAFTLLICITDIVLHDKKGFGKQRLLEVNEGLFAYFDALKDKYVYIDEIVDEVENITGVRYELGRRELDALEKYGMDKMTKSISLADDQYRYLKLDGIGAGHDKRMKIRKETKDAED